MVADNRPKFASKVILKCTKNNKVECHLIDPREPQKNSYIENLKRSLRDECRKEEIFDSISQCPPHVGPVELRLQQCPTAFLSWHQSPRRSAPCAIASRWQHVLRDCPTRNSRLSDPMILIEGRPDVRSACGLTSMIDLFMKNVI
jgi:transposase InsO family protein